MRADGLAPCVVLQTSPGNLQVWMQVSTTPLEPAVATSIGKQLARRYGGDLASSDWRHLGRLAGFTNVYPRTHKAFQFSNWATSGTMRRRRICRRNLAMNATFHDATQSLGSESARNALHAVYVRTSEFPVQVIQTDGLPEIALTCFGNELLGILSPSSVRGYVRDLLQFVNWVRQDCVALAQGWDIYAEPRKVRCAIKEYLTVVAQCRITLRPDMLGLRAAYINPTSHTKINVRMLLASLKKLYDVLHDRGFYPFPNPMVHEDAAKTLTAFRRDRREAMRNAVGRAPMPAASGIDEPPTDLRLSQNYFRLVNQEWIPHSIDDPDFPGLVFAAGQQFGWNLREFCVARTLFESGARISEVFDLTTADWSVSHFRHFFNSRSKGSFGCRVKTLLISQATAKLYRRYFDDGIHGRLAVDPRHLTTTDLNRLMRRSPRDLENVRIFLTARGTPMDANLFRDHYWRPALKAAGVHASPHIARHWFVTNALRTIENAATDEGDLGRRKHELIQYMCWRSGERTMKAYEHVERGASFARRLKAIHETMRRREREGGRNVLSSPAKQGLSSGVNAPPVTGDLAFLLGEDDDH